MNIDIEQTLVNLKVLGKMSSGEMLYTRNRYFQIISNSWIPISIRRWWYGESRQTMIKDINNLVVISENYLESNEISIGDKKRILNALIESKTGILELKKLYNQDAYIIARLELLYNRIVKNVSETYFSEDNDTDS